MTISGVGSQSLGAVSSIGETQSGIKVSETQQMLRGLLLEGAIADRINHLSGQGPRNALAVDPDEDTWAPQARISNRPQFQGDASLPMLFPPNEEEGDFFLGVRDMPFPRGTRPSETGAPLLARNSSPQATWDAYRVGLPDDIDEPLPSPSTAADNKIAREVSERISHFWEGMITDFEEREGADLVQYNYDRDMGYLLSEGAKLLKSTQGSSGWSGFNLTNDVRHFLADQRTRVETEYQKGMAALQGSSGQQRDVAMLQELTHKLNRLQTS